MNPNDPQLRRDDFDDCFADQPAPVSPDGDLARGQFHLRRRRRVIGGAVAAAVAIVIIAVPFVSSQATGPIFDPAQTPTAVPPTQSATCAPATIKIADAITDPANRPISEIKTVPDVIAGEKIKLQALSTTGEMLIEVGGRTEGDQGGAIYHAGQLYIENIATGDRTVVRDNDNLPQNLNTYPAALDQNYAVWIEEHSDDDSQDWVMRAFNRSTGETTTIIDSASTPDEDDFAPDDVSLWNGSLFWVAAEDSPDGKSTKSRIYERRLDAEGAAQVLVEDAGNLVTTEGWLYYVRWVDGIEGSALYRMSLTDRKAELIHRDERGERNGEVTAFGAVSAWPVGKELVVYRDATLIARLTPRQGHEVRDPVAVNGAIVFSSGEGEDSPGMLDDPKGLVLDLQAGCQLYQLAPEVTVGDTFLAAGQYVAWAVSTPAQDGTRDWHIGRLR